MTAYTRGASRERQVAERLRDQGYVVYRCAGSKGGADLVALKDGQRPRLVEVKATQRGPYSGFPPVERKRIREDALQAGAHAVLAWWPAHKKAIAWLPSGAWP